MSIPYDPSWETILKPLLETTNMSRLFQFIQEERLQKEIFPAQELVFNAFNLTALSKLKVVILGQDPYHNIGQAHGLSFSVPKGIAIPPSLKNIYTELSTDIPGFQQPNHGDLTTWATQGVLLLNATLTVRAHEPGSHQKKGWEQFTDQIIQQLSDQCPHIVFLLWGNYAIKKSVLINQQKHLILTSVHPSPLSVYRGFFGSKPFSKTNAFLVKNHLEPIDWQV
ncbi:uracil-DNA glycosylase [Sphingobacterium sp. HJSM2_6]|uniref:uracil-DNA glycosylase n=1 Tax=Sphingobacterium sp. HJSM2_6 TaxID=3366264 RepID=UPI003BC91A8E